MKPLWIIVDNGNVFEGHRGHWSDCFFTADSIMDILSFLSEPDGQFAQFTWEIRPMTAEELERFPDAPSL